ncbi:hypothetical protein DPMN_174913 [Dreissena polymorpha]|uniref:Uncharacterized protein n=1 Tax=Dreissena polymorpha TaxID=45954 RepID=A0A9D4E5I0_DREPO|nr:hypothetical protein DPMN_174913 [Dreissena polymorpha]
MVRREGKISNFKGNNHIIQMLSGKEKFGESFVTGYYASSVCMKEDHTDTDLYTSTVKGHNRKRINNTTLEPGSVNFCKVSNDGGHIYITGNNEIVIADISSHSFDRIDKHPGMKDSRGMHITECGNVLVCDQGFEPVTPGVLPES